MRNITNWALYIEKDAVKWSYGDFDKEFQEAVVNFVTGMGKFGEELLGEAGIAEITFDINRETGNLSSEIFVVSLMNQFFFIMSDPQVTLKLIKATGGIAAEIQEIMSAVLVGQCAIVYSQFTTEATKKERKKMAAIWQELILDLSPKYQEQIEMILGQDSCNFSMIDFEDLIFLHYYLRKLPQFQEKTIKQWAIVIDSSGIESPLVYNIDKDPSILCGYLGAIASFLMSIFAANPRQLIFGTNNIQKMTFINGKEYTLVLDAPITQLIKDSVFLNKLMELDTVILKDLSLPLKKQTILEMLDLREKELMGLDIKALFDTFLSNN